MTVANLRGTAEAGWTFALPTYVFMASFLGLTAFGLWRILAGGGRADPVVTPPHLGAATQGVGLWLLLRAFASGCTAMTGVEAVSNGVGSFWRKQEGRTRRRLALNLSARSRPERRWRSSWRRSSSKAPGSRCWPCR